MKHQILIEESGVRFDVAEGESVLDGALRAGIAFPHECTFGGCGTCRVKLLSGDVAYEEPPMALSDAEAGAGYALACQARPCGDLVIGVAAGAADFAPPARVAATVLEVDALAPGVTRLVLQLPAGTASHIPGQYAALHLPDGRARHFSMSSPATDGTIDFQIRRIPGGAFSDRYLRACRPGVALALDYPLGTFCHHARDYRPMILAATGTGFAPLKAIVESLLDGDDTPPIHLYWGMRTEADLYLTDDIAAWAQRLDDFTFVPVLSRAGTSWEGRRGHVQQAIVADHPDLSEHAIYLCGSPEMIRDAKPLFAQHGASLQHLYVDGFTFQDSAARAA